MWAYFTSAKGGADGTAEYFECDLLRDPGVAGFGAGCVRVKVDLDGSGLAARE